MRDPFRRDRVKQSLDQAPSLLTILPKASRQERITPDAMAMSRIQFQPGMSSSQSPEQYGTEQQWEAVFQQPAGQMDSVLRHAESRSMALLMGVATGAISAGVAVIR